MLDVPSMEGVGHCFNSSPAIARMAACKPFVTVLVVACDPSHELLRLGWSAALDFSEKLLSRRPTQRRCQDAAMQHLDLTGLAYSVEKAKIIVGGLSRHGLPIDMPMAKGSRRSEPSRFCQGDCP